MSGFYGSVLPMLFVSFFSTCAFAQSTTSEQILATVPYISELIKEVSCNDADFKVKTLVAAGADAHTFKLTPADRTSVEKASLVFYVGSGFEIWLVRKSKNSPKNSRSLTEGMQLSAFGDEGKNDKSGHSHGHHEESLDPHIWHSPRLTLEASQKLVTELSKLHPTKAEKLKQCQQDFEGKIKKEVAELKTKIENIPKSSRVLATNHDAFGYLAETFDFRVLSITGISTEAAATPAQLTSVINKVKKEGVKAVFLETSASQASIQTVSKQTGIRIGGTLHADGLGPLGSGAETITGLWRTNLETIILALK